jgi:hypothetical protein
MFSQKNFSKPLPGDVESSFLMPPDEGEVRLGRSGRGSDQVERMP